MILKHALKSFNLLKILPSASFTAQLQFRNLSEVLQKVNKKTSTDLQADTYGQPKFYKYFNIFLVDNGFQKHISPDLLFRYKQALEEYDELNDIIQHPNNASQSTESDKSFHLLAKDEIDSVAQQLLSLQDQILNQTIVDDRDVNECTFEIRAGVGGKEASLFAEELFLVYTKFFAYNGWNLRREPDEFKQVNFEDNSSLSASTVEVCGQSCYKMLRHEAGVHRVQRVCVV